MKSWEMLKYQSETFDRRKGKRVTSHSILNECK